AYLDATAARAVIRDFAIPQQVGPGESDARPVLPSFCYEWAEGEEPPQPATPGGASRAAYVVGEFARARGLQSPGRLVASAKSWLCHPGVHRTSPLLPWQGAPEVTRISPVEASTRYLVHLREAWDAAFPAEPLARQDLALTVPASFDEVARELTVAAAHKAGLSRLTLLEEPQAAFYAWMAEHSRPEEPARQPGRITLVCDVGGGTSDFTLIEARPTQEGSIRFHRLAVGDHLLLGGDNMDLALAHHLEARLNPAGRLDPRRWGLLLQACRAAKEQLLRPEAPETWGISIAGGARVVGGALQTQLTRDEVGTLLLDGFCPRVGAHERPATTRSGFREFGLPYAADPAITRHLAAFLADHADAAHAANGRRGLPDFILFNGGVFESPSLRDRILEVLNAWRLELAPESAPILALPHRRLDLAVARGAAYSRWLRHQPQARIAAGLARAHYIAIGTRNADQPAAVCLAPAGLEEGQEIVLPQHFQLRLRQPVEFSLYQSSTRLNDRAGDLVAVDPAQLTGLPPIRTVVTAGRTKEAETAEVQLHARLTEIGTLDLRCAEAEGRRSWKLEFDVRGQSPRAVDAVRPPTVSLGGEAVESAVVEACRELVRRTFHTESASSSPPDPSQLVRELETLAGRARETWPLPLLRTLWADLHQHESGRRRTAMHEARWLNLLGFCLRPGFGYPVDDWRVGQTWRLFAAGTAFPRNEMCRAEWCILWRRIAGGLGSGHQRAIADTFSAAFRPRPGKRIPYGGHELSEIWRLLGSLDLLPIPTKVELGLSLLERLERRQEPPLLRAMAWSLGRLGARVPAYGPLNTLVPPETVGLWLERLLGKPPADPECLFAVVQLARRTGDRYRDIDEPLRARVAAWLENGAAPSTDLALVREGGDLDTGAESHVFGESLPPGLHLDAPGPETPPSPSP
ncbi:MAG: hsp70 family protein, partial [Verrucomicrobiales bacterium]|nr:hsp70 family protein [Verrucomicrobiales bacterium]